MVYFTPMRKIGLYIEQKRAWGRLVCEGVAAYARANGNWELEMLEKDDIADRRRLAPFDGFIARVTDARTACRLNRLKKPVADIYGDAARWSPDFRHSGTNFIFKAVRQDNVAVGRLAANHFIEHRFARFAYCGYSGMRFSKERQAAFTECLKENHFGCDVYNAPSSASSAFESSIANNSERIGAGADAAELISWLKSLETPCAVFCANDIRGYNVRKACAAAGLAVPEDIAILGVDNDSLICNFTAPPLSSIDPDAFGLGYAAAEFLQIKIDGGTDEHPRKIAPRELVDRESTRIFPVKPEWLSTALVFIRRNISRHISAAQVCEHVNLSHTTVNEAFHEKLNSSIQKEIRHVALSEAKRLLTTTSLPVAEVSRRAGFASQQYFSNVFAKAFGVTPTAMRDG